MRPFLMILLAVTLASLSMPAFAQECLFKEKENDSFAMALKNFHDVLSVLVHGPAERGDFTHVRRRAGELANLRDKIFTAQLPQKLYRRCQEISAMAKELSGAVDELMVLSSAEASDEKGLKAAFDRVHNGYRNLNNSLTTLEDLFEAFHQILRPLWHNAYPGKDTAAIKAQIPKLKVRAKLILSTAKGSEKSRVGNAEELLNTVTTLEEAADADDDLAILEALKLVHTAYENAAGHH